MLLCFTTVILIDVEKVAYTRGSKHIADDFHGHVGAVNTFCQHTLVKSIHFKDGIDDNLNKTYNLKKKNSICPYNSISTVIFAERQTVAEQPCQSLHFSAGQAR